MRVAFVDHQHHWLLRVDQERGTHTPSAVRSLPQVHAHVHACMPTCARACAGRPMLVAAMLLGHFAKREAEVAFVHKYSGGQGLLFICVAWMGKPAIRGREGGVVSTTTRPQART